MILDFLEDILWSYISLFILIGAGLYLTFSSGFFQLKSLCEFSNIKKEIQENTSKQGISPIRLFFASTGGMIGLGNITSISDAIVKGGPGIILWMIFASFIGMMIKYSEIYLGIKYRKYNAEQKEYYGGPVNFIFAAFSSRVLVWLFVILFTIYSIEIYQFNVLIEQAENVSSYSKHYFMPILLILVLLGGFKSTKILIRICTYMMPIMLISYFLFFIFILYQYSALLPQFFFDIFYYAWNPHAAIGGFVGTTMIYTLHQATMGAIYSGDIGIGYDSSMQSNTSLKNASSQGKVAMWSLLTDTVICIQTVTIVYLTSAWKSNTTNSNQMISDIISDHVPYGVWAYTFIAFISAYTTIICFINVGKKLAFQTGGYKLEILYRILAVVVFVLFSFTDMNIARSIMGISGGLLIILNLSAIIKLRHAIKFK